MERGLQLPSRGAGAARVWHHRHESNGGTRLNGPVQPGLRPIGRDLALGPPIALRAAIAARICEMKLCLTQLRALSQATICGHTCA